MKGIIISGFAGIGKSTLAKSGNIVDLESTPFNKNWALYADVAIHMANSGYNVAVSTHSELRQEFLNRGVEYIFVRPAANAKETYLQNYSIRGNEESFIELFDNNWDSFRESLEGESVITLKEGEYLRDILGFLIYREQKK